MEFYGDYHTHTVFSHGKGSIEDNAVSARNAGLKEIGITDHGFAHPAFGLRERKLPVMRSLCSAAQEKTGVKVLLGVESNIIGTDGKTDLKESLYDKFDLYLAGFHKFVLFRPRAFFRMFLPNMATAYLKKDKPSLSLIKENTRTFINVIKNNPVDVITHLNYFCFADGAEVAKACADYGTFLELNAKKEHLSDEELYKILKTDVRFIVDSDAHSPARVGEVSLAERIAERLGIDNSRIVNAGGKKPQFRFNAYKSEKGR